jgi:hypothetical protein
MKLHRLLYALALSFALVHAQIPVIAPRQSYVDGAGSPCAGCSIYSYAAGTNTPKATFTDAGLNVQNSNPVSLDTAGTAQIWLGAGNYKLILKDTAGGTVWTQDNVIGGGSYLSSGGGALSGPISAPSSTFTTQTVTGADQVGTLQGGAVQSSALLSSSYSATAAASAKQLILAGYNASSTLGGGTFQWVSTAMTPDYVITFPPSNDSSGNSGVWMRAGGYSQTITPEMAGAVGDAAVYTGAMTSSSAVVTGTNFTSTMVGKSVAVAGAGSGGTTLWTTVLSYQSSTQLTLNANAVTTVAGANVVIGTDDSAAILRAMNLLNTLAQASPATLARIQFAPKIYLIHQSMPLPAGTVSGTGGDLWEVTATGNATIIQAADDTPIFRMASPAGGTSRNWRMSNIRFQYAANQASLCDWNAHTFSKNCHSIGIEFDPQGDAPNGTFNFTASNLEFVNTYRGVSFSPEAVTAGRNFPTWGCEFNGIKGDNAMTGATFYLGNAQLNWRSHALHLPQGLHPVGGHLPELALERGLRFLCLARACHVPERLRFGDSLESVEFDLGANVQLYTNGVSELEITNLRFEQVAPDLRERVSGYDFLGQRLPHHDPRPQDEIDLRGCAYGDQRLPRIQAFGAQVNIEDAVADADFASEARFTGYISGTTLTLPTGGISQGNIYTGMTLSTSGCSLTGGTTISSGSGLVWTVNNSQTCGSAGSPVTFTAAGATTGTAYMANTSGNDSAHWGHVTFGKGHVVCGDQRHADAHLRDTRRAPILRRGTDSISPKARRSPPSTRSRCPPRAPSQPRPSPRPAALLSSRG